MFWLILLVVFTVSVWFFSTQIFLPMYRGIPLFPIFRRADLSKRISEARDDVDEAKIEKEADKLENEAERIRKGR